MGMAKNNFRKVGVAGIALAGSLMVFSTVIAMNRYVKRPDEKDVSSVVNFTVPPPPPQVAQPKRQPQRQAPRRSDRPALAPMPSLGASLSGIAVELPEYGGGQISEDATSLLGDLDNVALTGETVDKAPVLQSPPPAYPTRAKQREIEGRVVVSVLVGSDGCVKNFKIIEAVPSGAFEETVKGAVPGWKFTPGEYKGLPTETWVNVPLAFSLN